MLPYWYPAAFMPELTIVSAVCSTSCSLTSQPNEFQSFQPIGGVRARPLFSAAAGVAVASATTGTAAATSASAARVRPALRIGHLFVAARSPEGALSATSLSDFPWTENRIDASLSISRFVDHVGGVDNGLPPASSGARALTGRGGPCFASGGGCPAQSWPRWYSRPSRSCSPARRPRSPTAVSG